MGGNLTTDLQWISCSIVVLWFDKDCNSPVPFSGHISSQTVSLNELCFLIFVNPNSFSIISSLSLHDHSWNRNFLTRAPNNPENVASGLNVFNWSCLVIGHLPSSSGGCRICKFIRIKKCIIQKNKMHYTKKTNFPTSVSLSKFAFIVAVNSWKFSS